jgi:hypothetical protein
MKPEKPLKIQSLGHPPPPHHLIELMEIRVPIKSKKLFHTIAQNLIKQPLKSVRGEI